MFCRKGGDKYKNFEPEYRSKIKQIILNDKKVTFKKNNDFNPKLNILEFSLQNIIGRDFKKNDNLLFEITNARETYFFSKAKHKLQYLVTQQINTIR